MMSSSVMKWGGMAALLAGVIGCGNKAAPKPERDPVPPPTASSTAASVVTAAPAPKGIPTFTLEKFAPAGTSPSAVFAVEGALMVVEGQRVGRIVDEAIDWVGRIPKGSVALGDNIIQSVVGYWPDGIGVSFVSGNGRAPEPTYWPLTGKGLKHIAGGGGLARIQGIAHVGGSTILVSADNTSEPEFTTVRGPELPRKLILGVEAGCKPAEMHNWGDPQRHVAVSPHTIESSSAGTLVSLGRLCERIANPAAEVWDKAGKSKIVDLSQWWKRIDYFPSPVLVKGTGDEIFAYSNSWSPVLRYHDGAFEALPLLERPIQGIFTSPRGQLFAHDGTAIHAWEGGKWSVVGRFAPKVEVGKLVVDEKGTFWTGGGSVQRLKETPAEAKAEETACPSWFVYVYPVAEKSEPKFTFPATRKALSSFPEAAELILVDLGPNAWNRHLGIAVKSKAQGEAVVAHVKATMKDEDPRLFCYTPPEKARRIDVDGKAK